MWVPHIPHICHKSYKYIYHKSPQIYLSQIPQIYLSQIPQIYLSLLHILEKKMSYGEITCECHTTYTPHIQGSKVFLKVEKRIWDRHKSCFDIKVKDISRLSDILWHWIFPQSGKRFEIRSEMMKFKKIVKGGNWWLFQISSVVFSSGGCILVSPD